MSGGSSYGSGSGSTRRYGSYGSSNDLFSSSSSSSSGLPPLPSIGSSPFDTLPSLSSSGLPALPSGSSSSSSNKRDGIYGDSSSGLPPLPPLPGRRTSSAEDSLRSFQSSRRRPIASSSSSGTTLFSTTRDLPPLNSYYDRIPFDGTGKPYPGPGRLGPDGKPYTIHDYPYGSGGPFRAPPPPPPSNKPFVPSQPIPTGYRPPEPKEPELPFYRPSPTVSGRILDRIDEIGTYRRKNEFPPVHAFFPEYTESDDEDTPSAGTSRAPKDSGYRGRRGRRKSIDGSDISRPSSPDMDLGSPLGSSVGNAGLEPLTFARTRPTHRAPPTSLLSSTRPSTEGLSSSLGSMSLSGGLPPLSSPSTGSGGISGLSSTRPPGSSGSGSGVRRRKSSLDLSGDFNAASPFSGSGIGGSSPFGGLGGSSPFSGTTGTGSGLDFGASPFSTSGLPPLGRSGSGSYRSTRSPGSGSTGRF